MHWPYRRHDDKFDVEGEGSGVGSRPLIGGRA